MKALTILLAGTLAAGAVHAATVTPVSATGSSNYPSYADFNAIDTGAGAATSDWASFQQGAGSYLNLDLGAAYNLTTAFVTDRVTSGGGNNSFFGGLYDFTTQYTLQAYTDATFTTTMGSAFTFTKSAPGSTATPGDFLDTENVAGLSGRYIRYTVAAAAGVNPGLSDIHFSATVPEPATWGLMLAGFGMVGFAARRRRSTVAA